MFGKRFVTASEAEQGQQLKEAMVKNITGMGRLVGRRLYGHAFEFAPTFKLFIDANHRPVIRGTDNAIWNRIHLIPFEVSIPKPEQDQYLLDKLKAEAPGILAWAVEGCLKWQRDGLAKPSVVEQAGREYREEMDLTAEFITDRCEKEQGATEKFSDLYAAFQEYCRGIHEEPPTQTAFAKELGEKGFRPDRNGQGQRLRRGLRLIPLGQRVEPGNVSGEEFFKNMDEYDAN